MPAIFKRQSNLQCFFCRSAVPFPPNARNFKCPACACWNRYDDKGEIISDEPAMHEEYLNSRSFAKRASHSTDRLPTMYGPGPFCHSCQTNQMLIINLLSNYLPDPSSPEYQTREEMLPAYRESLHARYPPVCDSCLPQVEEEIRQKEQMARAKALGGWLSKGKERRRRVSGSFVEKERIVPKEIYWWRVRGCLFVASYIISMAASLGALWGYHPFSWLSFSYPILPLAVVASLLWTAWDPTYHATRRAQIQGRDVRIQGKRTYNTVQVLAWATRLLSSIIVSISWFRPATARLSETPLDSVLPHPASLRNLYLCTVFSIELIAIFISCYVLHIQQPPAIRLVDTHTHKFDKSRSGTPFPDPVHAHTPTPKTPVLSEHDALLSLSLSNNPVIARVNPVFGLPSLQSAPVQQPRTPTQKQQPQGEDDMDWTPTHAEAASAGPAFGQKRASAAVEDDSWLRPQRFFAPEKPTGLEGLFESARIQDEPMTLQQRGGADTRTQKLSGHLWKWGPFYTLFIALAAGCIGYALKQRGVIF